VVHVGVGSHNLFNIVLALALREQNGVADDFGIEMLEGMANHQERAVQQAAGDLLLYAPIVKHDDLASALAYLIGRVELTRWLREQAVSETRHRYGNTITDPNNDHH
jgi:RHH-type proline utilization regulon transcriptional repressor/proline dehydrogenase/delta 1-pyrroline-5-carboxylate dehydrogenase